MELPALKVGKPRPTPVVRGGITHQKMLGCAFSVQVNLKMQGNWMKIPLLPKKLDNKQEAFFVTQ